MEIENKTKTDKTSPHSPEEEMWGDTTVQVNVTLYRDAKGKYEQKAFLLKLKQASDGVVLATYVIEAAQFAAAGGAGSASADATTLKLLPRQKDSKVKDCLLKVTVGCKFLREVTGDDDASTVMTDRSAEDVDLSGFDEVGAGDQVT